MTDSFISNTILFGKIKIKNQFFILNGNIIHVLLPIYYICIFYFSKRVFIFDINK